MLNQNLIISLGVTSLAGIAIWFYFKERLGKVEKKFDLMFNIFQEQQKTTQALNNNLNSLTNDIYQNKVISNDETEDIIDNTNNLINVSDTEANDDESYYSTDSEVVSDSEENDEPIKIDSNKENINTNLNLESMPFSINGADLNINPSMVATMLGGIGLPLEQVSIGNNLDITIEEDNVNLEHNIDEDNAVENNAVENKVDLDNVEENIIDIDDVDENNVVENNVVENNVDEDNVDEDEDEDEEDEDEDNLDIAETESVISENSLDYNNVDIHNPKTTVKILKALAQKKGLRSRGLKKEKLVQLLENNP